MKKPAKKKAPAKMPRLKPLPLEHGRGGKSRGPAKAKTAPARKKTLARAQEPEAVDPKPPPGTERHPELQPANAPPSQPAEPDAPATDAPPPRPSTSPAPTGDNALMNMIAGKPNG